MFSHLHTTRANDAPAEAQPTTEGLLITWAARYDALVSLLTIGQEQAFRRMMVRLAQLQPGEAALDVGCGTGSLSMAARQRVGARGRVCGIDPSAQMIARARHKAARRGLDIEYQLAAIEQLPYPDHTFDVALSSLMMHHLPDDIKRRGLAEVARVLKPGGRLLVIDASRPSGPWHSDLHDQPALMRAAGFARAEVGKTGIPLLGYALGRTAEA